MTGFAQTNDGGKFRLDAAVSAGALNTQLPSFADNAAGVEVAVFSQRSTFFGLQIKGGDYLYSARYKQVPITVGYRIGKPRPEREISLWTNWTPFAYAGAGVSHARDKQPDGFPTPGTWDFCMQGSGGVDHPSKYFTWRVAEVSWTETNTSLRSLRSLGVSTGLVFHLRR